MEKRIKIDVLQKSFLVDMRDTAKASRNRSYLNASPCCSAKVVQKKFCSVCDKEVDVSAVEQKLVKIGKTYHSIPKEMLDGVIDAFEEMEDLVVTAILPYKADFGEFMKEGLMVLSNSKTARKASQYSELKALAKGRIMVVKGVVRKNEFQMLLFESNNKLYLRKLVSADRLYPEVESADYPLNESVVAVENQILDKVAVQDFDLMAFVDSRQTKEEEIIEKYVVGGAELPTLEVVERADEKSVELAKLNEILASIK
jgi:hypothetical protein